MSTEHAWLRTRLGWVHVQGHEAGLVRLSFLEGKPPDGEHRLGPFTRDAVDRLERYFAGDLQAIESVAIAPKGTPFQLSVWRELRKISAGHFISYADLAERLGKPRAVRAVGQASAKNPIAIVVPCHRVVESDGGLGGYSAGQERKAYLLAHERVQTLKPKPRMKRAPRRPEPVSDAPLPLFAGLIPREHAVS
jgi:methylated-DNA-[protein]-cysteine S-methyltransferase